MASIDVKNNNVQPSGLERLFASAVLLWALVLPWSLAAMQIALGLVIVLGLAVIVRHGVRIPVSHPLIIIWGIYLLLRLVSVVLSPQPGFSFRAFWHTDWVSLALPVLAAAGSFLRRRKKVLQVFIFSSAAVSVYAIIQSVVGIDWLRGRPLTHIGNFYRSVGTYDLYLTLAGNLLMAFFVAHVFFLQERTSRRDKLLYLAASILILGGVLSTFGRSAWLAIFVVLPLGTLVINWRHFLKITIPAIILVSVFVFSVPVVRQRFTSSFNTLQNQDRVNLWKTSVRMIVDHPITGIGPGLFGSTFPDYKVPGEYDATGHAHNDYLNLAAQSGFLALLAWISFWGLWLYYSIKAFKTTASRTQDAGILLSAMFGITAILVAAIFQCYYTDLENNICWWFLATMSFPAIFGHKGIVRQTEISYAQIP